MHGVQELEGFGLRGVLCVVTKPGDDQGGVLMVFGRELVWCMK